LKLGVDYTAWGVIEIESYKLIDISKYTLKAYTKDFYISIKDKLSRVPIQSENIIVNITVLNAPTIMEISNNISLNPNHPLINNSKWGSYKKFFEDRLLMEIESLQRRAVDNKDYNKQSNRGVFLVPNIADDKLEFKNSNYMNYKILNPIPNKENKEIKLKITISASDYYYFEEEVLVPNTAEGLTIYLIDKGTRVRIQQGDEPNNESEVIFN
jgi:hypothetical protein